MRNNNKSFLLQGFFFSVLQWHITYRIPQFRGSQHTESHFVKCQQTETPLHNVTLASQIFGVKVKALKAPTFDSQIHMLCSPFSVVQPSRLQGRQQKLSYVLQSIESKILLKAPALFQRKTTGPLAIRANNYKINDER